MARTVWVHASECVCVRVLVCMCACVYVGGCVYVHLAERTGVQGMISRLLSSKLFKVSCHHQHRYYLLTQAANVLQLCPWGERRQEMVEFFFYVLCLDGIGQLIFTYVRIRTRPMHQSANEYLPIWAFYREISICTSVYVCRHENSYFTE